MQILKLLEDSELKRVEALYVGNMMAGQLDKQSHLGALISDWVGFRGIEAMTVEAACASGASGTTNCHGSCWIRIGFQRPGRWC